MTIRIVGANTINGVKMRKIILKLANQINDRVIISLIDEDNLDNLPKIYVDNRLIGEGKILSEKELKKYIKE